MVSPFGNKRVEERPSLDEVLLACALAWGERSTCPRGKVGAVIARDGRILSTGYVGSLPKTPHCTEVGCLIGPDGGCTRTTHAEMNAILWAARRGTPLEGAELYCTHSPCLSCARAIFTVGIKRLVYIHEYRDGSGKELLKSLGVLVIKKEGEDEGGKARVDCGGSTS